ncbi:MAG: response regulator [Methylococcaceae bacterium]
MKIINVVIIEDRPMARDELKYLLSQHADISVVGEFENTETAWPILASGTIDGVFLDINIATESDTAGLDMAGKINRLGLANPPWIVFTTGYDQYEEQAKKIKHFGYLVKPLDEYKITPILNRVREL